MPPSLTPASSAADDVTELPLAPNWGTFRQTPEQFARNGERAALAAEQDECWVWIEGYSDDPSRPLRKRKHLVDIEAQGEVVNGERQYPSWVRAEIADDGAARVIARDGTDRDWTPRDFAPARVRPTSVRATEPIVAVLGVPHDLGRAARPATNARRGPRRGASRSSSRSGDSGDSDGESRPRRCLGCGADISHKRRQARVCGDTCEKRVKRQARRELDRASDDRRATLAPDEFDRLWHRFGGWTLLAAATATPEQIAEVVLGPDESRPARKRGRAAYMAAA